jgi:hypothetical protein
MQTSKSKSKRMTKALIGVMTTGLVATHFVQPASAQIASKNIPVSINISGTAPAGVTNATVTLSCKNTTSTSNYQGEKATSVTLAANQVNLNNFALESVPAGALCKFGVSGIGATQTAGSPAIGTVTLILGGAPASDPTRNITGPTPGVSSDFLSLADNTTAVINLQFPAVGTGATTTTTVVGSSTIPGQTTTTVKGGIIFLPIETPASTIPSATSTTGLATTTTGASSSSTSTIPATTTTGPPTTVASVLPVATTTAPAPTTKAPVVEPKPTDTKPARAKRPTKNKRKATLVGKKAATKKKSLNVRSTKTAQR